MRDTEAAEATEAQRVNAAVSRLGSTVARECRQAQGQAAGQGAPRQKGDGVHGLLPSGGLIPSTCVYRPPCGNLEQGSRSGAWRETRPRRPAGRPGPLSVEVEAHPDCHHRLPGCSGAGFLRHHAARRRARLALTKIYPGVGQRPAGRSQTRSVLCGHGAVEAGTLQGFAIHGLQRHGLLSRPHALGRDTHDRSRSCGLRAGFGVAPGQRGGRGWDLTIEPRSLALPCTTRRLLVGARPA